MRKMSCTSYFFLEKWYQLSSLQNLMLLEIGVLGMAANASSVLEEGTSASLGFALSYLLARACLVAMLMYAAFINQGRLMAFVRKILKLFE